MTDSIVLTHSGKLGDFIYTWPIASWLRNTTGRKIHWVLAECFRPFRKVVNLTMLQPFTEKVSFVNFPVQTYGCGGQPYRFYPAEYGIEGEYYNLGFRWWPKGKFVTQYIAEEHDFKWDENYILNITEPHKELNEYENIKEERVGTEQEVIPLSQSEKLDLNKDILFNVRRMACARERHCFFSGMAAILYFAEIPFYLY
jgi:hypothetical protein